MSKPVLAILALMVALGLGTPAAMADHEDHDRDDQHEHGNKHRHGNKHFDHDAGQGWERRGGYEYRTYGERDGRPPGWSQGRKTGWGNCGLPPGQAKKYGCRTYTYQSVPHYYYQDEGGAIIIRRPRIELHGSLDIVP